VIERLVEMLTAAEGEAFTDAALRLLTNLLSSDKNRTLFKQLGGLSVLKMLMNECKYVRSW